MRRRSPSLSLSNLRGANLCFEQDEFFNGIGEIAGIQGEPTLPDEIEWKPFPAFPPSARLAVVVGEPTKSGMYLIRVKVPSGVKLMPHRHPEDRIYTVMSGVFYIGLGEEFDADKVKAYPPGSVIVLPGDTWHFHYAKSGEYVTQVTAIGPLGLEYLDPEDDPRLKSNDAAPRKLGHCRLSPARSPFFAGEVRPKETVGDVLGGVVIRL